MSKNDATSIPTSAMLNAQALEAESAAIAAESNETLTITFNKKALKKAVFGTVAAAAATYLLTRVLGSSDDEDNETPTED